jgi:hypothetical protein
MIPPGPHKSSFIASVLAKLCKRGHTIHVEADGRISICNHHALQRREARKARDKARHARKKAARETENSQRGEESRNVGKRRCEQEWHGITWRDVPGKDEANKRLNFSMLRRGGCWKHCQKLHGDELKAALATISSRQKVNGDQGGGRLKMKSLNSTNNQL